MLATGFGYFTHEPADITSLLPPGSYRHTCHAIDMPAYRGRRVLLLGGRQSAFEWAALLAEAGASAVHMSYRHDTPDFAEADWSWVSGLVDRIVDEPDWFRESSPDEQAQHRYRLWAEGRLKGRTLAGEPPARQIGISASMHPTDWGCFAARRGPCRSLSMQANRS